MAGSQWHTGSKCLHDSVNVFSFNTVDDVIAAPRNEVAALHNLNFRLERLSMLLLVIHRLSYKVLEFLHQIVKPLRYIASVDPWECVSVWFSVGIG